MDNDFVVTMLTALVKQMGGEVHITGETIEGLDGGIAVYEDFSRNRWTLKLMTKEEYENYIEENEVEND